MTPVEKVLAPTAGKVHRSPKRSERDAAEKVSIKIGTQKAKILLELDRLGDAIPHQLLPASGCGAPSHVQTRLDMLEADGLVELTNERRLSSWNGKPFVWKITDEGREAAADLRQRMAA
jgi:hypothetical protein